MADETAQNDVAKWGEIFTSAYFPSLLLVCLGVWLHAADSLLTATMMPSIVDDIGGTALIAWTVALYQLGSIVSGAACGLLSLRYGAINPMLVAALLFGFGCAVSALAPSMEILLLGRLLQGFGGGALVAMAFVSANIFFPQRLIGRVIGVISAVWGTSAFFGPLVGGLCVEYGHWRYGFWFFAVQAAFLCLWLFMRKADASELQKQVEMVAITGDHPHSSRFPIARLLVLSAAVLCIAFAGVDVSVWKTSTFVVLGLILFLYFLHIDAKRADNRLLPIKPLGLTTPVGAALLMILCFSAATIPIGVYAPFLINKIHGTSELVSGYILALESIFWSFAAIATAGLGEDKDKRTIIWGMSLIVLSCVGLAFAVANGPLWFIATCAALQGIGFGMAWSFILRLAIKLAPATETQRVVSAFPTIQTLGYALGAAYIGIIANAAGIESAVGAGLKFVAVLTFLGALPIALAGMVAMFKFVGFKKAV